MADTITWGELIAQARFLLQDRDADRYRYSDEALMSACHLACLTTKQFRPDVFFGRYLVDGKDSVCFPAPPYTEGQLTTLKAQATPFPEIYHQPVILFISGYAEIVNEEYTGTERAASLLSSFKGQIMMGGAA